MKRAISVLTAILMLMASAYGVMAGAVGENEKYITCSRSMAGTACLDTLGACCDITALKSKIIADVKAQGKIDLSEFNIPFEKTYTSALTSLIYTQIPEIFSISLKNNLSYSTFSSVIETVTVTYNMTKEEYDSQLAECEKAADALTGDLKSSSLSDLYKILLVHDRIVCKAEYDESETKPDKSHNINGILLDNTGVCTGYSKTFMYLMSKLGIESYVVESDALTHGWNIVVLNGKKYHVDLTFDDATPNTDGKVYHDYLLKSTAYMKAHNHNATDYDSSPVDTTYDDYFWGNSAASFQYKDGSVYYIDNYNSTLNKINPATDRISEIAGLDSEWKNTDGIYTYTWLRTLENGKKISNFSRLISDGTDLYYSDAKKIYRLEGTTGTPVYEMDDSSLCIVGFDITDGKITVDAGASTSDWNYTRTADINGNTGDSSGGDDTDTGDNNNNGNNSDTGFFAKLAAFFRKIIEAIKNLFS